MPGVLRPYTLVDVLGTINDQSGLGSQSASTALTVPLSTVGEVDETTSVGDAAFGSLSTATTWDQGVWNAGTWS